MSDDDALRAQNMATVRAYVEAMNEWNFDRMRELTADDFSLEFLFGAPGLPSRVDGADTVIEFQRPFSEKVHTENMHDLKLDTRHSDPAEVMLTAKGAFDFKEPGLTYENDYICFFRVEDGKLKSWQENFDSVRLVTGFGGSVVSPF